ncbi:MULTISPECIES: long-chain-fatty-acid--CoA ligase [Neobacillus]|uniref:Long-chain fatty acid--CoA ligase n=2 Tax=Neobacillus citreus TaxID=2833578 RepID=A0A9J6ML94_9BACI|nr:long-chain fatty acid--CoA ligase [Neobacillus citreus]MCH6263973.1 long-chain fatty acid--CoA ligase [Neobacillus citreus]
MLNLNDISQLSIYEMLEQSVQKYPHRLAVIDGLIELDYVRLKETVDAFASVLYQKGFQKGDRVGLMLPNSVHYMVSYYAAMRLGGIVVQVNPLYQTSELEYMLEDADPKWFICGRNQSEKLERVKKFENVHVIFTEDENGSNQVLLKEKVNELPPLNINPKEDIAVLQYTGGTTGKSKGVMLTHFNIVCNIHQSGEVVAPVMVEGEERLLGISPLTHAMAMTNMNNAIRTAATYIILEKFNATRVLELIRQYRPTFMVGSPTMYIALLNHPDLEKYDLSCFKICVSGSAPLPVEVIKELERKTGAQIFEGYGLSEGTTSTHRTPLGGKRKIGSVGVPIPGTVSKIVDMETGFEEVPVGENGELIIKGPQVMKGYWKKPEETMLTVRNGWLYTGDIAYRDEDGFYYISGRKKDMVIAGGLNIYPAEVEEVLYQHPKVAEACAFGVPDAYLGEKLLAVIVLKKGESLTENEFLSWCEGRIARYKIPRAVEFRDALPKTIVGKILRRQLVEEYKTKLQI